MWKQDQSLLSEIDLDVLLQLDVAKTVQDFERLLHALAETLNLRNLVYHCPNMPGHSIRDPYIVLTYGQDWIEHYRKSNYILIDPVFKHGAHSLLPLDWKSVPKEGAKVVQLFDEASQAGVGRQGITIPIRGPENGFWALFSVTTDDEDAAWSVRKREILASLVNVAHFIHGKSYELQRREEIVDFGAITRREIEALSWTAQGKTIADIAVIMGIASETVKAHLDSARFKLGALNRVHAVARAIRHGLIR